MGVALRKEDLPSFEELQAAPDYSAAFGAIESLEEFRRVVQTFEGDMTRWRVGTRTRLNNNLDKMRQLAPSLSAADVRPLVTQFADAALSELERQLQVHSSGLRGLPGGSTVLQKINSIGGNAGRFIRKLVKRIDVILAKNVEALTSMQSDLVGFKAEFEADVLFEDAIESAIGRYPLINAYLAR